MKKEKGDQIINDLSLHDKLKIPLYNLLKQQCNQDDKELKTPKKSSDINLASEKDNLINYTEKNINHFVLEFQSHGYLSESDDSFVKASAFNNKSKQLLTCDDEKLRLWAIHDRRIHLMKTFCLASEIYVQSIFYDPIYEIYILSLNEKIKGSQNENNYLKGCLRIINSNNTEDSVLDSVVFQFGQINCVTYNKFKHEVN